MGDLKNMYSFFEIASTLSTSLFIIFGIILIHKFNKEFFGVSGFKSKLISLSFALLTMSLYMGGTNAVLSKDKNAYFKMTVFYFLSFVLTVILLQLFHKKKSRYSIEELGLMEGHQFEYACSEILKSNGFKKVEVTRGSGDFGVDITAYKDKEKYGIQCKCYSHKLDNTPIQEVIGGLAYYKCTKGAVMTNQYFTEPAKELARINNIELWDHDILKNMAQGCSLYNNNGIDKADRSFKTDEENENINNSEDIKKLEDSPDNSENFTNGFTEEKRNYYIKRYNEILEKQKIKNNAINYANKIAKKENTDDLCKFLQEFIKSTIEYLDCYYNQINNFGISVYDFDIYYEKYEIVFFLHLNSGTKVSSIKRTKNALAEYLNVEYVQIDVNSKAYIAVPMPIYIKNLLYKLRLSTTNYS